MDSQTSKSDLNINALRGKCTCIQRGINYYKVLSLRWNCADTEIKEAYQRCAIRYNPARQKNEGAEAIFALAAEAYDVLSDPLRRAVYDQYGEEGLKNGVAEPERFMKPYVYHNEPMRTFREFFATENPYDDLLNILTEPQSLLEFPEGQGIKRKEESLIKTLFLTLSEIFFGGIKKMKIQKLVLLDDKSTTSSMEKILTIPIKPGIPAGTKIVFPEEGDQSPSKIPADVIFVTEDRPHETFRREGSDLHMTVDICLKEALTGTVITLNTVDDRILRIPITSIVTPDYTKCVPGEGMPFPANPKQKGDLILRFNIEFPVYLSLTNKNYIKKAFEVSGTNVENAEYVHRLILAKKMRRNVNDDVPFRRGVKKLICEM
ncbi:PREDICTED: dnaJ homolog subfamily B member 13-like [Trachymyrmex septentrionalis]|uniref:dnaJ homolog subfamily B member 13-like n=1 Tax=Trachymyrmex septentrionalis TaxID=34720 RepID=UPI00084F713C|nr:PREDICTED: dnaJ homolog subfamily B member 13-like [Trachymyrmex septentrionalis]